MEQMVDFVLEMGWGALAHAKEGLHWIGNGFLLLYAAFGIAEVIHRLPKAVASLRRKAMLRRFRPAIARLAAVLISLGPLYISVEAFDRLRGISLH
jgi:hypothetical protein